MIELSIILVNYNTTDEIIKCIKSIIESDIKFSYEIIVVDNNSKNQAEILNRLNKHFSEIKIIASQKNLGFTGANNLGIKNARGQTLLFLNPDIIVQKDAIMELYKFLSTHRDSGLIGPLTIDESGSVDYYCGRSAPNLLTEFFHHSGLSKIFFKSKFFGQYLMTYWDHKTTRKVAAIQGSGMMMRKRDIIEIGMLDESFFLYGEDIDWCYRFLRAGKNNYLCAEAVVIHKRHASVRGNEALAYIIGCASMQKFFDKHYGCLTGIIYRLEMFCIYLTKFVISLCCKPKKSKLFSLHILWAIGMLKYLRDDKGYPFFKFAFSKFI